MDRDLSPDDRRELERLLVSAGRSDVERLSRLAEDLLELTRSGALDGGVEEPGRLRRLADRVDGVTDRHLSGARLRRLTVGALQLLRHRDRRGVELAQGGLLLALTLVNVLLFYTDQWVASGAAAVELVVLGLVWRFRREVLGEEPDGEVSAPDARTRSAAR